LKPIWVKEVSELLLEVVHLLVCYGKAVIINDLNIVVDQGELVGLVGPNGAGKSTLLRAISGLIAREKEDKRGTPGGDITIGGAVIFNGERVDKIPAHNIVKKGLIHCPERGMPFREMTVIENLYAGAYLLKNKKEVRDNLEKVYRVFPVLNERYNQIAGTLSGGEQQMLAIGRALMLRPKLLCIDEPSTGLAPIIRVEVFEKIIEIKELGIPILLVEQEVTTVFKIASRNYVLYSGKISAEGTGEQLLQDEVIRSTYLGL
jgi:branched-chain amino acid transport system ATP-binding protein